MRPVALLQLRGAGLKRAGRTLLEGLNIELQEGQALVILGPAGVGKSSLLAALAGAAAPDLQTSGEWLLPTGALAYVPQKSPSELCLQALQSEAQVVFLDEPTRGLSEAQHEALRAQLQAYRQRGAVVLVTHDLGFAREVAELVCLLSGGRSLFSGEAQDLFERPQGVLVQRFLTQGNCWPGPKPPALPSHFHWVLPAKLAGMGAPGLSQDLEDDLAAISEAGISLLVSLTPQAPPPEQLRAYGLASRHHPVPDMGVPSLHGAANICREIERHCAEGGRVAIHCKAGLGRTGTMLAAFLVWRGETAAQAFERLATINRGFIQNNLQRDFVLRFEEGFPPRHTHGEET